MIKNEVLSIVESAIGETGEELNKGEIAFHCPFCHHRKRKLQVNMDSDRNVYGFYRCWVCKESGKSLFTLFKKLNVGGPKFSELADAMDMPDRSRSSYKNNDSIEEPLSLPEEFKPIWNQSEGFEWRYAVRYLEKRGLTRGDMVKYGIGYCDTGKYQHRIVIPSYDEDGDLNYFTGRYFFGDENMKYLNPTTTKNVIIFEDLVNWTEPVTITEGMFDAIAVRRNATCLMGKRLQNALYHKLVTMRPPEINLVLDKDAIESSINISERLLSEGLNVKLVALNDKDPSDIGFVNTWKTIDKTNTLDFSSLMRYKLRI